MSDSNDYLGQCLLCGAGIHSLTSTEAILDENLDRYFCSEQCQYLYYEDRVARGVSA